VLAADACGDVGLTVARLEAATRRRLTKLLPPAAAVGGPVDTTAAVSADVFRSCITEVAADESVDAVIVIAVPTAVADVTAAIVGASVTKPLAAVLLHQAETVRLLWPAGSPGQDAQPVPSQPGPAQAGSAQAVPSYAFPESAIRSMGHAARYRAWRDAQRARLPELGGIDLAGAHAIIGGFLATAPEGGWLSADAAARMLACYKIPMVASRAVCSAAEAAQAAAELGGHVVLKAEVAGLIHKTDVGAVKLDLRNEQEVTTAYAELADQFGATLQRVLVQPMLAGGVETLVGVVQEPVFGPLVVFGLGGVATEVLGDHVARQSPLTDIDAAEMVRGVRAAPLLTGHRGSPPVDIAGLTDMLLRV